MAQLLQHFFKMKSQHYDSIVIGAGQGGSLAKHLAQAGRKTALIERRLLGGSCINWGCTPTKTMIASARIAHLVRRAADFGIQTSQLDIDLHQIRQRKRDIVFDFRGEYKKSVEPIKNLDIICGEAHFSGGKTLQVELQNGETQQLQAEEIIVATGACPAIPSISGLDESGYLTSESLMEIDKIPEHLIILGGGYIAVEFAQMFRRFGAQVTIIERGEQLLAKEDIDVASALAEILQDEGIDILLNCEASQISQGTKVLSVTADSKNGERTIKGTHLLLAAGQTPNTKSLHLEQAGIETDKKSYIRVNDSLETNVPGIYAMGDVKGGPQFTHIAYDDTRILCGNLLDSNSQTIKDRIIPYVVFTDPQLGRVGMTEKSAREAGHKIRVAKLPLSETARALETGETKGFLKAIVDDDNDQILGGAILSAEGGEVMAVLQMAMQAKLPYTALRDGIFAHPTQVESFNNLFLKMDRER
jgi:pyruvate/2-oxoglutarate dehydrogenase complex dihydrolipoamide dehydrogenase (E3) component